MRTFSLLLLAVTLAACDTLDSSVQTQAERTTRVRLRYELTGTYAACTVAHNNAMRQTMQQPVSALPWQEKYTVEVSQTTPFVASIAATCSDSTKEGKSDVFIYANDKLVKTGNAAGFGATASATYTITAGN